MVKDPANYFLERTSSKYAVGFVGKKGVTLSKCTYVHKLARKRHIYAILDKKEIISHKCLNVVCVMCVIQCKNFIISLITEVSNSENVYSIMVCIYGQTEH